MNDEEPENIETLIDNIKEDLEVFKKYEKIEKIGEGAFSIVYKAKNRETQELFSIKAMPLYDSAFINTNKVAKKEIIFTEIFKDNRNSIKLYDKYEQANTLFLVLDYCDGDLNKYLEKAENGFSIYEIKVIFYQLNNILSEIRSKDMVHNDVKLENILVKFKNNSNEFDIKLSDYGLSQLISHTKDLSKNEWGIVPFTDENKENVYKLEKLDLFVLGIDLYRMIFKETCESFDDYEETIETIQDEDLKDLLKKLIVEDAHERIEWDDYFKHPFFKIDKIDFNKIKNIVKIK